MITQIEVRVQQVVHSFYEVTRFNIDHFRIFPEQVNPFLRIAVILDEVLPDKSIPAITLVQVQPFVKTGLPDGVVW